MPPQFTGRVGAPPPIDPATGRAKQGAPPPPQAPRAASETPQQTQARRARQLAKAGRAGNQEKILRLQRKLGVPPQAPPTAFPQPPPLQTVTPQFPTQAAGQPLQPLFPQTPASSFQPPFPTNTAGGGSTSSTTFDFPPTDVSLFPSRAQPFETPTPFQQPAAFDASQINQLIAQAGQAPQGAPEAIAAGLTPFLQGQPGAGPLTQAAIERFKLETQPILQGEAELAGLGASPALLESQARGLAAALPQFIQADLDNRFRAAQGLQAQQQLGQQGVETGLQGAIAAGQIGQSQQEIDIQEKLGIGQLNLASRGQTFDQQVQAAQFRLSEEIERGNLVVREGQLQLSERVQNEQLSQSAAELSARIGDQQAQRVIQAAQVLVQASLGFAANVSVPLAQLDTTRAIAAIEAMMKAGASLEAIEDQILQFAQDARDRDAAIAAGVFQIGVPGFGASSVSLTEQV